MDVENQISQNNTIALVFSILGGVIVLLADFGGWTEETAYSWDYEYYVYIGSDSMPGWGNIVLFTVVIALFYTAFVSYKGMMGQQSPELLKSGIAASSIALAVILIGALNFIIEVEDAKDWWFDWGFYAGLVGSILSLLFLNLARNKP